jgi:SAM-dependent methyltransferase
MSVLASNSARPRRQDAGRDDQRAPHQGAAASARDGCARLPEEFCLPRGYQQQSAALTRDGGAVQAGGEYWNDDRVAASARYQWHVYAWAARLVRERGVRSVLDVGCGPGVKLDRLIAPVCGDIRGIDQQSAVAAARRLGSRGEYRVVDLERAGPGPVDRSFGLVICADVVEHLLDPDPAMEMMAGFCGPDSLVLLSTPDRARLRGRGCMASPKPEHVREWSTPEFLRFLSSRNFEVLEYRLLPGADEPAASGWAREWLWRARLAETSARRCLAVLCRPRTT